ncbi:hypothetical protein [Salinisphaera hydrothermalis]|uniref:hypothetical protein n=1 Tax=Salinisphaera hydrothermalis TaxID=563188 RepID=UPI003340ACEA
MSRRDFIAGRALEAIDIAVYAAYTQQQPAADAGITRVVGARSRMTCRESDDEDEAPVMLAAATRNERRLVRIKPRPMDGRAC